MKKETIWKDRLRHLGLPLSFTVYSIDSERLYVKTGLVKTEVNELLLYRILDIKSSRTLGQKIFGVGTITLYCADQSSRTLELKNIKNCVETHKMISNLVEEIRNKNGMSGREIFGAAGMSMEHTEHLCDEC